MFPSEPDFRTFVADFEQLAADWQKKADELNAALARGSATEEHQAFTLTMLSPTQIGSLTFTDQATSTSPVQLRQAILDAVARLGVRAANAQASDVARILDAPELGSQMRQSVPSEMRERAALEDDEVDPFEGKRGAATTDPGDGSPRPASFDEVMAWAEEQSDESSPVSLDMAETMSDVEGWEPSMLNRDAATIEAELEREVKALVENTRDLGPRLQRIEEESSGKLASVVVNGAGRLVDVTFRPNFRNASAQQLTDEVARLLREGQQAASNRLFAEAFESGAASDATTDPTLAMFTRLSEAANPDHEDLSNESRSKR